MSGSSIAGSDLQTEVVIWTPDARDAVWIASALRRAKLPCRIVSTAASVCGVIAETQNAVIIISEEALSPGSLPCLRDALATQPPWSDMPLVVLSSGGCDTESDDRRPLDIAALGHVAMLQRPVRSAMLVTAVRSAIRTRSRQFQVRDYLQERLRAEEEVNRHAGELARSNADLQRFACATSHDLREPLRNITSYAQLLQRRCGSALDDNCTNYLGVILHSAQRMEALTNDLLSYSRLANGGDVPFKPVSLEMVLNWAKANLDRAFEESGTELVVVGHLPKVLGDEVQLVQLFQNLLSNAIKYRQPEVRNRVCLTVQQRDSSWILTFQDNGRGFHPDHQERIFGLFKRLHGREIPGTGIGLAICKTIVEKHGGSIWAEGTPGNGASFHVSLPVITKNA